MRRSHTILLVAGLLALGLTACSPTGAPDEVQASPTSSKTTPASPGAESADALCVTGESAGDACIVTAQTVADDVSFADYDVVKIVDSTLRGTVVVDGVRELVVTNTRFGADVVVSGVGVVVVKLSDITGSLTLSDAEHATLVQNTIGGDLNCDGLRADGEGNRVAGANSCMAD